MCGWVDVRMGGFFEVWFGGLYKKSRQDEIKGEKNYINEN